MLFFFFGNKNVLFLDDHDLHHFLTHSLYPPGTTFKSSVATSVDEEQKLTQEYASYQRKLDQEKEEYDNY